MSVPKSLQTVIDQFASAPRTLRLPLLLEYADKLPEVPAEVAADQGRFEKVEEPSTSAHLGWLYYRTCP